MSLWLRASIPFASSVGLSHPSPAPTRPSASVTGLALFPSSGSPAPPRLGSPPFFVCLGLSPTPFPGSVLGSLCLSRPEWLALLTNPVGRREWPNTATVSLRSSSPSSSPGGTQLIPPSSGHRPQLRVALSTALSRALATELRQGRRPAQAYSSSKVLERLRAPRSSASSPRPRRPAPGTRGAEPPPVGRGACIPELSVAQAPEPR